VPPDAGLDLIPKFVLVRYALSRIGLRDAAVNAEIRTAVKRFSAEDLLGFNPLSEPPANDLPHRCDCGLQNQRGRTFCKQCRKRLEIYSRYRVWMGALASTYISERCGIVFGAGYPDVLVAQHQRGREITDFIIAATAGPRLATADIKTFAAALEDLVRMYEHHAAIEDTIVFPAWKETLTADAMDEMNEKFEEIEHEQFGEDGFESALKQIAEIEQSLGFTDLTQFTAPPPPAAK